MNENCYICVRLAILFLYFIRKFISVDFSVNYR